MSRLGWTGLEAWHIAHAVVMGALLCGCAATDNGAPKSREVTVAEFSRNQPADPEETKIPAPQAEAGETSLPGATASTPSSEPVAEPQSAEAHEDEPTQPAAAAGSADATAVDPSFSPTRLRTGDQLIVDSVIGQVSGEPIFADEFLEPIADQLRAEASRLDRRAFNSWARDLIAKRVHEVVLNELFLAEAESALTKEQKQGLLYFVRNLREETVSSEGGSVRGTNDQLLREQGITLDEYLALERDKALIQKLIYERIRPRVIVAWRDVEREFSRRNVQTEEQSKVTLARIRLNKTNHVELIEQVKARFAAGEAFPDVAASVGQTLASAVATDTYSMGPGGVSDIAELVDTLKNPLAGLQAGQTTPPIELDRYVYWLHIVKVDEPRKLDLYDPEYQRSLVAEMNDRRRKEEYDRYIDSLFSKGIHDDLDRMTDRLVAIAITRYGP